MNINVHEQTNPWSLGLVSVKGSFTSERVKEAVRKKLNDFGFDLNKHIVGCTTDGASVMMKFGRAISSEHQHCNAHLLHLAICDVLYAKSSKDVVAQRQSSEENTTNIGRSARNYVLAPVSLPVRQQTSSASESCDDDQDEEGDDADDVFCTGLNLSVPCPSLQEQFLLFRLFRKSPLKNERLQDYVKDKFSKELSLQLDCRTRWNSLLSMLRRFFLLKDYITPALRVVRSIDTFSEDEWAVISHLVEALSPLEVVLKDICSEDATLIKAESSIAFVMKKLVNQKSILASKLHQANIDRYFSKRNKEVVSLLMFLNNPAESSVGNDFQSFQYLSRTTLKKVAEKIFNRLFPELPETDSDESEDQGTVVDLASNSLERDENHEMSLVQEYEREMNKLSSADVP